MTVVNSYVNNIKPKEKKFSYVLIKNNSHKYPAVKKKKLTK